MDLLYKSNTYEIIGAAMDVHKELGNGFLEAVYHEAFCIELLARNVPFKSQEPLKISYKGSMLSKFYIADFICFNKIIIELKALSSLSSEHEAQILNYLKATGYKLGLLINFGERSLVVKRIIL